MGYRNVLIIHESAVVRNLLSSYILSELSDVKISQANHPLKAIEEIKEKQFNVILTPQFLRKFSGVELFEIAKCSDLNRNTAFVVMTSSSDQRSINDIKEKGVQHILKAPFQAADIGALINEICDPKKLRRQDRFNVPGTKASFTLYNELISADVVNISRNSILCEFSLKNYILDLFRPLSIDIYFPEQYKKSHIENVECKILQYKGIGASDSSLPEKVQLVLIIQNMESENRLALESTLKMVEEDYQKWSEASV